MDDELEAAREEFLSSQVGRALNEPPAPDPPQEWKAPIALSPGARPPVFPAHRLPAWLCDYVCAVAEYLQVPVDLPGMLALSAIATAAGGRAVVQPWAGWREPLNLYVTVAMPPGARKTPVFQHIIRPLEHAERLAVEAAKPEVAEARVRHQAAKAKADKAEKDAETASKEASEEAVHFASQMRLMAEAVTVPHIPRLLADDCTPESLMTLMCEQGGRIALYSDEGEVFGMMAGRYSTAGPNLGVYLKAHVGSPIRVDRKGRDPEYIERPAMTLGLTIQPHMLRDVAGIHGARGRGLLGRFLWAVPVSNMGTRSNDTAPVPDAVDARYLEYVAALVASLSEWVDPAVLPFTPEAAAELRRFADWLEPQLAEFGALGYLADWASKLVGHTARIAGLLSLASNVDTGWKVDVSAACVADAIKIAEYLIAHAVIAFDTMHFDPLVEDARALVNWISEREHFTRREIMQSHRRRFSTVDDIKPALNLLCEHEFIVELPRERPTGRGRPPGPKYIVNPRIMELD
jgi:hypothetical protein